MNKTDQRAVDKVDQACEEALLWVVNRLGGQSSLARYCEVTPQTVNEWVKSSKRVPMRYVADLSKSLRVSPKDLRPDHADILKGKPITRLIGPQPFNRKLLARNDSA